MPKKSNAVRRWEDEGGRLADQEFDATPMLRLLGAAVVAEWNDLQLAGRRRLFAAAVRSGTGDAAVTERLARFLHLYKGSERIPLEQP